MPGYRLSAWLRPLLTLAALAGVLSLAACGGGNGAPNNPNGPVAVPLAVLPATANVYSGTAVTLTINGGTSPYSVFSSDASILQVQPNVAGNTVTVVPNQVTVDSPVQLTIRDSAGHQVVAALTVKAALLINALTLKPDNFSPQCPSSAILSTTPTDTSGSTWICSGQTGSVAVRLQSSAGGGLAGRQVQFDIVQGDFQIFTEPAGAPETFALTYRVPTDQNGNAVARIRANPSAHQQIVIVQATFINPDGSLSSDFVRGLFVIQQTVAGSTVITVVPSTITITGANTQTCSSNVVSTFYIFGGQPPYTISNPFTQALQVSPLVVGASGGGFNVTTVGLCVSPATLAITDAAGHQTTVTFNNNLGTTPPSSLTSPNPIIITPSTLPTLGCGVSNNTTNIVATGGGTVTQAGATQTVTPATSFNTATALPAILSVLPATVSPGAAIQIQRQATGTVDSTMLPTAIVNVPVFISDTGQTKTVQVPVRNTCP